MSSEALSERELEEIKSWYEQTLHYSMHGHRNVLQSYKFDEVLEEVVELRERVGELEGALKFTDDWFKGTRGDSGFNPMPPGAYQVHEIVHTALSQANAQEKP